MHAIVAFLDMHFILKIIKIHKIIVPVHGEDTLNDQMYHKSGDFYLNNAL